MASAGVFSSVPGAGGRAALVAAAHSVASTAPVGNVTAAVFAPLPATVRFAAPAPGMVRGTALLPMRFSTLHSSMGTARRGEVAAGASGLYSSVRGFAASSRTTRSASLRFAAAATRESEGPPPPQPRFWARVAELWTKLKADGKRNAFTVLLLIFATGIATLACLKYPGSDYAVLIVNICDKAEKIYKFASHVLPIIFR